MPLTEPTELTEDMLAAAYQLAVADISNDFIKEIAYSRPLPHLLVAYPLLLETFTLYERYDIAEKAIGLRGPETIEPGARVHFTHWIPPYRDIVGTVLCIDSEDGIARVQVMTDFGEQLGPIPARVHLL